MELEVTPSRTVHHQELAPLTTLLEITSSFVPHTISPLPHSHPKGACSFNRIHSSSFTSLCVPLSSIKPETFHLPTSPLSQLNKYLSNFLTFTNHYPPTSFSLFHLTTLQATIKALQNNKIRPSISLHIGC